MKTKYLLTLMVGGLFAAPAGAEDIDLFLNPPTGTVETPNVLFLLDNSANWNATLYRDTATNNAVTKKNIIHQALYRVVTHPDIRDSVRIGYMTFTSTDGGKVMSRVQDLTADHQIELAEQIFGARIWTAGTSYPVGEYVVPTAPNGLYYQVTAAGTTDTSEPAWPAKKGETVVDGPTFVAVNTLDSNVEKIEAYNNAPYALSMNEAYLYYKGDTPRAGTDDGDEDSTAIGADGNYISPAADSCAKNFIIWLGNGAPDGGENNRAESVITALGGKLSTDPIPLSPDNQEANWGDEFARFLSGSDVVATKDDDQNINTYVVDVIDLDTVTTKPEQAARAFLRSMANQGQGRYFNAATVDELVDAVLEIIDEIQDVNSVFASTTLPVSVNVRGTNLNQVYMGVFRPDANALPRWMGNLKLYQLAVDTATDTLFLADKNGDPAESPTTGFVVSDAVSYWTHNSDYWGFHPEYADSDSPDGEVVEKGAAGQQLREASTRNLYTCTGSCGANNSLSATTFTTGNADITQAALGAASTAERDNIINWIRGADLFDENSDGATDDMRASIHGDVLHSRPAVINYNRNTPPDENDIIAFYGANDGVFHAVYGGKDGDANDGEEIWGFIPEEFFGELKTLYDNAPAITSAGGYKPYFADGNIGVYQDDGGDGVIDYVDGDKVHLFLSMRRGGRLLYALDVSNPTDPRLLWRKSYNDSGYGELGQTWSEPTVATINLNGTPKTVIVFGAGYDAAAEDAMPQGTATMGRGILVVDASNGNVIWQAGAAPSGASYNQTVADMAYPIPSDVTVLNADWDADGYADRAYVGDTGGQLWRVDMGDPSPANWSVTKLAEVGGGRKFLYAPDVVFASGHNAVLIGSGDREHPGDTAITHRFYMFKDTGSGTTLTESDLYDATANTIQDGADEQTRLAAEAELAAAQGWYITLRSGEKVVSGAVTLSGSTFFNTAQPTPAVSTSCSAGLGTARNYIVSYLDATATTEVDGVEGLSVDDRADTVVGGGFPPSPVPVIVQMGDRKYQAVVSGTRVLTPPKVQLERRHRIYWYRQMD